MNARTSRLLARVARVMFDNDPSEHRQPESQVLAGLKKAWQDTPAVRRDEARRGLVAATQALIEGAQHA